MAIEFTSGQIVDSPMGLGQQIRVSAPNMTQLDRVVYGPMDWRPATDALGNATFPVVGDKAIVATDTLTGEVWLVSWKKSARPPSPSRLDYGGVPAAAGTAKASNRLYAIRGNVRYAINSNAVLTDAQAALDAQTLSLLIVQTWNYAYAQKVKALNPSVLVGMYKDFAYMVTDPNSDGTYSSGIGLANAKPEWILTEDGGVTLHNPGFSWMTAGDIGNADYANTWARNVIAEAKTRGFDFVFADDVNPRIGSSDNPDIYPTTIQYQAAVQKGMVIISNAVRDSGLFVLPNIGSWHDGSIANAVDHGDIIAAICGCGMHEKGISFNFPPSRQGWLKYTILSMLKLQQSGGMHVAVATGTVTDTIVYRLMLAADMLTMQGPNKTMSGMHGPDNTNAYGGPIISIPAEDAMVGAIGVPMFDATAITTNVWRRDFSKGIVLVNINSTTTQTVALETPYSSAPAGLTHVSSVDMPFLSGLILSRD